jgi:hypothetical protein
MIMYHRNMYVGLAIGIAMVTGLLAATTISSVSALSAAPFAPGILNGFDPKPEPPGKDRGAVEFAPGQIGDPQIFAPGHAKLGGIGD